MPGLSGFETAKAIRSQERSGHTPNIFITASDIWEMVEFPVRLSVEAEILLPPVPKALTESHGMTRMEGAERLQETRTWRDAWYLAD